MITTKDKKLKAEYRRRLIRLRKAIDEALEHDSADRGLLPALASVYIYMWSNQSL